MEKNKFIILATFVLIIAIAFSSCDLINPSNNAKITLTAEDASCTEVWLNLKLNNISLPAKIFIKESDSTLVTANVNNSDTTLLVENLLPNKAYTFKAKIEKEKLISQAQITTMDTTSHNFTWETFTFGGVNGSSYLKDVAIINENNIWAVGEIHTADTDKFDKDSNWVQPYNAVHWNGQKWELKRILVDYRGQPNFAPLQGVFVLPDGKVIFSSGLPYLPNGNHWKLYHLWDMGVLDNEDGSVNSIWGTSIDNLYFVGNRGTIVHYNGSSWTKIEGGTELPFKDIFGNKDKIYCIATKLFSGKKSKLYKIKQDKALLVDNTNLSISSVSIYLLKKKLYVYGYLRLVQTEGKCGWEEISEPINFDGFSKIRGTNYNDIVTVGSFGKIEHSNGSTWRKSRIRDKNGNLIDFSSVSIKNNTLCAVGRSKVVIVIGRRWF